jgi:hypothetical protein
MDSKRLYHIRFVLYISLLVILTTLIALSIREDLLQKFVPRAVAMKGNLKVMDWHVAADTVIALCSFVISVSLFSLVSKKKDLYFRGIIFAFAIYILFVGVNHVINVLSIWVTWYFIDAIGKTLTAMAAIGIMLVLPVALEIIYRLKTPDEYREMIEETKKLRQELNELKEWKQEL